MNSRLYFKSNKWPIVYCGTEFEEFRESRFIKNLILHERFFLTRRKKKKNKRILDFDIFKKFRDLNKVSSLNLWQYLWIRFTNLNFKTIWTIKHVDRFKYYDVSRLDRAITRLFDNGCNKETQDSRCYLLGDKHVSVRINYSRCKCTKKKLNGVQFRLY